MSTKSETVERGVKILQSVFPIMKEEVKIKRLTDADLYIRIYPLLKEMIVRCFDPCP
jgi:hypothetical protein